MVHMISSPFMFSSFEMFLLRACPAVVLQLFDSMELLTLINISASSRALRRLFLSYAQRVWDPAKRFRRWFPNVLEFRRVLRSEDAVISGSFALQFFDRSFYVESDMDIFVRIAGVTGLCGFITSQGYRYQGRPLGYVLDALGRSAHIAKAAKNVTSFEDPLLAVYNFQKFVASETGRVEVLRVQVVVVDTDPVEHILFDFHSTVVMNFITADEAISVFPLSTLVHRLSYISRIREESDARSDGWMKKYEERGFVFVGPGNQHEARFFVKGHRHASDQHSWRIRFLHTGERSQYGPMIVAVGFEILSLENLAVADGSFIRIAEPYFAMSRSLSHLEMFLLRISPALLAHILTFFDISALLAFSRSSKMLRGVYTSYARAVWNPSVILKSWFLYSWSFRKVLRRCGGVLSGSLVFNFFDRVKARRRVMHIFIRPAGADDFCSWLFYEDYVCTSGDYDRYNPAWHSKRCADSENIREGTVLATYVFKKTSRPVNGVAKVYLIKVVIVNVDPIRYILFNFPCTDYDALWSFWTAGEMNFMTSDVAVSIFPYDTFVKRTSYLSWSGDDCTLPQAWFNKYKRRGVEVIQGTCKGMSISLRGGPRHVMDSHCWRIELEDDDVPDFVDNYYGRTAVDLPFEVLFLSGIDDDDIFRMKVAEPYAWRAILEAESGPVLEPDCHDY
ncbi:hypothetical protein CVT26_011182 [Gymnopilus dilepis]|uniref:Uncharacterized protein n=1 Tax=Gymnopilus dilepis TaxID=231916 RepID=A0A409VJP4_9AGAR|nr:hypothetical protein CVT26_011182 [Gymnopilus dilepis]